VKTTTTTETCGNYIVIFILPKSF